MTVVTCPACSAQLPANFKFCGECGAKLPARAVASPPPSSAGEPQAAARDEFRDVTILFADVTGFTALSERLDAESVHELMNACFDGLGRIVQAHGGHIDKYIGDSIMALFGAPTAHEDDPIRAAETALEMQAFVAKFATEHPTGTGNAPPFKMRIGLNCGTVVAGAIGAAVRRDYSVMGDAVNTASRLEAAADPGTILASGDFKRRVAQQFSFGAVRLLHLKGKEKPIEAYVLQGDRTSAAASTEADAPFVARSREAELIRLALNEDDTSGRWIEVRGPLGIGKTRLVEVALGRDRRLSVLRVTSRPSTAARPFALVRRIVQGVSHEILGTTEPPQSLDQFVRGLGPFADGLENYVSALWYIAAPDALGLKSPDPDPLTFRLTAERGLSILLANLARVRPTQVLFLDAYDFSDAETRNFLERFCASSPGEAPPIVTTVRGEGIASTQATAVIDLPALDDRSARELVKRVTKAAPLSEDVTRDIVRRGAGVPLFIKELVAKVEDDMASGATGAAAHSGARSTLTSALPGSLLGVMLARLDRLDPAARDFLGVCAVQGSEFSTKVASGIWRTRARAADDAKRMLDDLERRQFIDKIPGDGGRYTFSQELMQNACYDRMLRRDRRELHKSVAEVLIADAGDAQGVSPEVLATHYENSEQWLAAARQNVRAGDRAAALFANADALARYARALTALGEAGNQEVEHRAIAFDASRGAALVCLRIGDYAALKNHSAKMSDVASDPPAQVEAIRLRALAHMHGGDLEATEKLLKEATARLPEAEGGRGCTSVAGRLSYDYADVCYRLGRNNDAAAFIARCRALCDGAAAEVIRLDILEGRLAHVEGRFEDATALYERAHRAAQRAGSVSEEALTSNCMGNAARDSGRYAEAEAHFQRALDVWSRVGMTEAIAGAHNNLANLAISRGDRPRASHHYREALNAFEKIGNSAGRSIALMNLAILAIESGDATTAVRKADKACALLETTGNRMLLGLARVIKGEALIEMARFDDAQQLLDGVLKDYSEASHPLALAGAHRGLGRIRSAQDQNTSAIGNLAKSLELFDRLKRVQESARTQIHLAAAHRAQGDMKNARRLLTDAHKKFTDIGAGQDLEKCEAMLAALTSGDPDQ
jgi:class 3 adenylate cyclase